MKPKKYILRLNDEPFKSVSDSDTFFAQSLTPSFSAPSEELGARNMHVILACEIWQSFVPDISEGCLKPCARVSQDPGFLQKTR